MPSTCNYPMCVFPFKVKARCFRLRHCDTGWDAQARQKDEQTSSTFSALVNPFEVLGSNRYNFFTVQSEVSVESVPSVQNSGFLPSGMYIHTGQLYQLIKSRTKI